MSEYRVKPHWMNDEQWADSEATRAAMARAEKVGYGLLKISPKRYLVIQPDGAVATAAKTSDRWAYLDYRVVGGFEGLTLDEARDLLHKLWTGEAHPSD
jgi:hypothetical protein